LYIPPYGPGAKAGGIRGASAMGGQGEMHQHRRDSLPVCALHLIIWHTKNES
jgi:hypothetical protein